MSPGRVVLMLLEHRGRKVETRLVFNEAAQQVGRPHQIRLCLHPSSEGIEMSSCELEQSATGSDPSGLGGPASRRRTKGCV